jgi:uncharacterized membrane protein
MKSFCEISAGLVVFFLSGFHCIYGFAHLSDPGISCSAIRNSPYSRFLGVPLAAFGVIWFFLMSLVSARQCRPIASGASKGQFTYIADDALFTAQIVWLGIGLVSVFYFVYAEFRVGAMCPLCTLVHIDIIAQVFLLRSCNTYRSRMNPRALLVTDLAKLLRATYVWIAAAAILSLLSLVVFNWYIDLTPSVWSLGSASGASQPADAAKRVLGTSSPI